MQLKVFQLQIISSSGLSRSHWIRSSNDMSFLKPSSSLSNPICAAGSLAEKTGYTVLSSTLMRFSSYHIFYKHMHAFNIDVKITSQDYNLYVLVLSTFGVGRVIKSKDSDYVEGDIVVSPFTIV
ncbi:hypothetical protein Pyn_00462 [Prunus yedoensis var. nudiflora]|uniref:Uncharacterized protein n=1 Tax=Prunus yedoensis var. nudiflora TaxID=2094558 RepID=A0A314UA28_PRUYE|nr:hypothetical protein Pyn_00462 [Prunus yedoensis var. nudiflora]